MRTEESGRALLSVPWADTVSERKQMGVCFLTQSFLGVIYFSI